jgi:hypothetical protein
MNRVRTSWQRRRLRIAAGVLVVVALVLAVGLYYVPMRPTDSVSVTVQYSHDRPTEQIFATVIHDSAKARKVREIFEAALGPIHPVMGAACNLRADPIYTYDFEFTWRGLSTESVHWEILNCAEIEITRWGNLFAQWYAPLGPTQYDELVRLTGIPADPRLL